MDDLRKKKILDLVDALESLPPELVGASKNILQDNTNREFVKKFDATVAETRGMTLAKSIDFCWPESETSRQLLSAAMKSTAGLLLEMATNLDNDLKSVDKNLGKSCKSFSRVWFTIQDKLIGNQLAFPVKEIGNKTTQEVELAEDIAKFSRVPKVRDQLKTAASNLQYNGKQFI
jgi:hypothetical protein